MVLRCPQDSETANKAETHTRIYLDINDGIEHLLQQKRQTLDLNSHMGISTWNERAGEREWGCKRRLVARIAELVG